MEYINNGRLVTMLTGLFFAAYLPMGNFVSLNHSDRVANLKIVEGVDAVKDAWPWQALIIVKKRSQPNRLMLCGGTLVYNDWVLTTAECVADQSKIIIYFGVWNVSNRLEVGRIVRFPTKIVRHPCHEESQWDSGVSGNDMAMLRLNKSTYRFRSICLNGLNDWAELKAGGTLSGCIATGYGLTERAKVLQEVKFSNVSKKLCIDYFGKEVITGDGVVCATDAQVTSKDTCKGDMGGPLMCPTSRSGCNGFYMAAMTLAGSVTCGSGVPGIYAAVPPKLDWINYVKKHGNSPNETAGCAVSNIKTVGKRPPAFSKIEGYINESEIAIISRTLNITPLINDP